MRTVEITVYNFSELPEKAREKVIEKRRNSNRELYEFQADDYWTGRLSDLGFEKAKIYYTIYGGQGDGACFDATCDTEKLSQAIGQPIEGEVRIDEANNRYTHAWCRKIEADDDEAAQEKLEELRLDLCREIHKDIEDDYDYMTGREEAIEGLESEGGEYVVIDGNVLAW